MQDAEPLFVSRSIIVTLGRQPILLLSVTVTMPDVWRSVIGAEHLNPVRDFSVCASKRFRFDALVDATSARQTTDFGGC